jgi:hypothetical protein
MLSNLYRFAAIVNLLSAPRKRFPKKFYPPEIAVKARDRNNAIRLARSGRKPAATRIADGAL